MKAVLFDLDGVIINSERHWRQFEAGLFASDIVDSDDISPEETAGLGCEETYEYVDSEYGVELPKDEYTQRYHEAAPEIYARSEPPEGLAPTLDHLAENGIKRAIVSSSPRQWIELAVTEHDIGPVSLLVGTDDVEGPNKPAPYSYQYAMDRLSIAPKEAVIIEDSAIGIEAALESGARCIAYDPRNGTDLSEVDAVVRSWTQLKTLLL